MHAGDVGSGRVVEPGKVDESIDCLVEEYLVSRDNRQEGVREGGGSAGSRQRVVRNGF